MPNTDLDDLRRSWVRHLRAANRSANTIKTYDAATQYMIRYLRDEHRVTDAADVDKALFQQWIIDLQARNKPSSVSNRYRSAQQFWRWVVEVEELLPVSPLAGTEPPQVPEEPPDMIGVDQLKALLRDCAGRDFTSLRDTAILRMFDDTGLRLSELTGLEVDDLDQDARVAAVMRKGRRPGMAPYGNKTAVALDRYLRVRSDVRGAKGRTALWLSARTGEPLKSNGVAQMIRRRGEAIGIKNLHPHQLRHTSVDAFLTAGGTESDAMRLFGWKSRAMLQRYAAKRADDRAVEAHHRLAPGDNRL